MPFDSLPYDTHVELLQRARDIIARGWCQGTPYYEVTNSYCMIGAVYEAISPNFTRTCADASAGAMLAKELMKKYLAPEVLPLILKSPSKYWKWKEIDRDIVAAYIKNEDAGVIISMFNDKDARKKAEVLAVFDRAIARAKSA
jgi:hypothetical protein